MLEIDFDTANDIVINKSNPQYQRYHGGDKAVNDAVTAAFLRKYPGEYDLNDKTPEALRGGAAPEAGNPDQPGTDQLEVAGPEAAAKLAGYLGVTPGGPEFESFRAEVNDYIAANFKSYDDFQAVAAAVESKIGPEAAVKVLRDALRGRGK